MIEFKNISAGYYKEKDVLKNISFRVESGSWTGIIGPNGAGKSTMLKVLCGLLGCQGDVFLDSAVKEHVPLTAISKPEFAKVLAFMPQSIENVFPFSVAEFVMLGRYPHLGAFKNPSSRDFKIVDEILEFIGISEFKNRNINELSGGERQKVFIAQALAQETEIIVLDEPVSYLDIGARTDILNILAALNKERKKTIVSTMHDLNAAAEFCDNLILIVDGQIKSTGSPEKVLDYKIIEETYKTKVLVKENPMSKKPFVIPIKGNY